MTNTPLNPDAVDRVAKALMDDAGYTWGNATEKFRDGFRHHARIALTVSQPVVNSVEELVTTRAGLALANSAFNEGLSAGIKACNESLEGEPFVKPVSPYRPEVNTNGR